jgi:NYN domain
MYIDGYNFYCSLNDPKHHPEHLHLGWCNFALLGRRIIGDRGTLGIIKYFTAPVEDFGKPGERERQALWLRAMQTVSEVKIVHGFHTGDRSAPRDKRHLTRKEKETDINLSLAMIADATMRVYDSAILLCGDYDQRPTVRSVSAEWSRAVEV